MDRHNKMLIDATHPEETRVVVLRSGRVEEFDFESASRKLLRGNIYLAKVTRVEPSLQAAFVDYGGNRHGFLAFSEIHPDYYQIPVADREVLKREEAEEEARAEAEADERARSRSRRSRYPSRHRAHEADDGRSRQSYGDVGDAETIDAATDIPSEAEPLESGSTTMAAAAYDDVRTSDPATDADTAASGDSDAFPHGQHLSDSEPAAHLGDAGEASLEDAPVPRGNVEDIGIEDVGVSENGNGDQDIVEDVVTDEEDALEEVPERPRQRMRQYKIQEVIKRRQILLVQVVKEERGNKGAALTTYISLAGRYTVLMPNTGRGGGISRKITQPQDRKRLKAIAEELEVSEGMGLIIRTAGAARTKQEIRRDYEYLLRLWESVRELTLSSTAPCLVYEEGNLIKRSIRDLYSKDVEQVVVAGRESFREASDFMGMLMPGHDENVIAYEGSEPLFTRFGIERQLNAMFSPYVTLRSGGYLVINQTEALVAIDVNSGKSTREFSIEETAYATNCEAAEEIARQLKLRDLAGLIVVDFIDMEEKRNNRGVERRLKEALRHDRARIQIGRISHFGLLEMSRQRLRTGVLEGSTTQCPHCQGTGIIRSTESVALAVLRGLEDHLMKQPASLVATTTSSVALYILNHKRTFINDMEARHGITIAIEASDRMQGANFSIERNAAAPSAPARSISRGAVSMDWGFEPSAEDDDRDTDAEPSRDSGRSRPRDRDDDEMGARERDGEGGDGRSGRRRRRRRGRRDRGDEGADRGARAGSGREPSSEDGGREGRPRHGRRPEWDAPPPGEGDESYSVEASPEPSHRDVAEPVEVDEPHDEPVVSASDDSERGDRPRRGRRRGRRGGRGRGRETGGQDGDPAPAIDATSEADWSGHDISRPGAEQPPMSDDPRFDTLSRSMLPAYQPHTSVESRSTIVEIVDVATRIPVERPEPVRIIEDSIVGMSGRETSNALEQASVTVVEAISPPDAPATAATPEPELHRAEASPPPMEQVSNTPASPPRRGWWNRRSAS